MQLDCVERIQWKQNIQGVLRRLYDLFGFLDLMISEEYQKGVKVQRIRMVISQFESEKIKRSNEKSNVVILILRVSFDHLEPSKLASISGWSSIESLATNESAYDLGLLNRI